MSRVEHLAGKEVETKSEEDSFGVRWIKDAEGKRPPYVMLVPLLEVLAEALSSGVGSQKVMGVYEQLIGKMGSEFKVLLETPLEEINRVSGERVAEAVTRVRSGDIVIEPGYDGVFGKVKIWKEAKTKGEEAPIDQGTLF
jgi:PHP family Zn ribbon phosphoesterase